MNVQGFRLFTFANVIPHFTFDNFVIGLATHTVQFEGSAVVPRNDFIVNEPSDRKVKAGRKLNSVPDPNMLNQFQKTF